MRKMFFIEHMRADKRGVAAVEFALILPLMLFIYLGASEVTQGLMASRKATLVARTLADLVSQQQSGVNLADTDLQEVFGAAATIMSPFAVTGTPAPLQATISSIAFISDPSNTS